MAKNVVFGTFPARGMPSGEAGEWDHWDASSGQRKGKGKEGQQFSRGGINSDNRKRSRFARKEIQAKGEASAIMTQG